MLGGLDTVSYTHLDVYKRQLQGQRSHGMCQPPREEETLIKAYLMAWNALVENREDFMEQWTEQLQSENLLEGYRAEKFIEYTDGAEPLTEMDTDFMLKTLDHIKVFEDGTLLVVFLDGTEIECKNEEE